MRLLFLSNLYPPFDLGGFEQWCHEVTLHLRQRGHTVHVLTSRYGLDGAKPEEDAVTRSLYLQADLHYYRPGDFFLKRPFQERANVQELHRVLQQFEPDLVLVWGMWNLSRWLPYWAERWLPGRVAYYMASYWPGDPDIHEEYWRLPAKRPVTNLLKRALSALALAQLRAEGYPPPLRFEHVTCCSRYVRDTLVASGALPASAGVLYGGIDPEPFLRQPRQASSDGRLRLLYFGVLSPHKGVHTALEALGLLKERHLLERVKLTLIGSGHPDYEARLHRLVEELGLGEAVQFVGRVPREQIPSWLGGFDVFLFTSVWPEPFGRVIIEAMASGLVVVGADVGGSREIFRDYDSELLFQPGDAQGLAERIERVLADPSLMERLSEEGRRLVLERFALERMVNDFEAWLGGILT